MFAGLLLRPSSSGANKDYINLMPAQAQPFCQISAGAKLMLLDLAHENSQINNERYFRLSMGPEVLSAKELRFSEIVDFRIPAPRL